MEPDLALSIGVLVAAFSIPGILSALSDSRAPRASALTILIGGGLILYALRMQPGGYTLGEIPDAMMRAWNAFF
ncbi:MAG: hypothetical protein AAF943_01645 [Pseudomonadota bacterium]